VRHTTFRQADTAHCSQL